MPEEKTAEVTQPSPFNETSWNTVPPTKQEPIKEDEPEKPTAETKDPVIEEKDEKIKEEKPVSDTPDEPLKIPAATPPPVQDLPDDKKKLDEQKAEVKFANETSEKIFNLLKEGKEDDVYNYLNQKKTLSSLDKLPSTDIIKLQLKNENKDYTPEEIEDIFNEKYSLPEKPEQLLEETDEEFAVRENKYKEKLGVVDRRIERHAKDSKAELLKLQQELVLPDIPQKPLEPQEPTKDQLEAIQKQRDYFLQTVNGSLSKLTSYESTFKDQEVEIPIAISVTDKEKQDLKPLLDSLNTDLPQFFQQLNWLDKDGNINTDKVVNDLHLIQNKDSVIPKFVNEAGNKRVAEERKRQKNIDFSGQQRRGSLDPSIQEKVDKDVKSFLAAT